MAPSNNPSSSSMLSDDRPGGGAGAGAGVGVGGGSESSSSYRHRRPTHHATTASAAVAAAEAAASYILSDKTVVRNRSSISGVGGGGGGGGGNNVNSGNNNKINLVGSGNGGAAVVGGGGSGSGGTSFLLRMQRQREAIMQRRKRRERAFSSRIAAWIAVLVIGTMFLFDGGSRGQRRDQVNLDHYSGRGPSSSAEGRMVATDGSGVASNPPKEKGASSGSNGYGNGAKVGVPLPPSMERKHLKQNASSPRGRHREARDAAPNDRSTEPKAPAVVPKVVSIAEDAKALASAGETIGSGGHHRHTIPPVLIFTYRTNLLTVPESEMTDDEDVALSHNVRDTISLHQQPGSTTTVRFLTDDDCVESIRAALGPDTNLTAHFENEERGMYKADVCRGAALYETGGMYFDIDIEARMSLWDAISPHTEFVTTFVHKDSNHHGGFFQAFIGVTPRHPIMRRYLELFVEYYEGRVSVNGPLGVYFLRMAYDTVVGEDGDRSKNVDLWQEVRYSPDKFPDVKREHWGDRRACQMLVVAPPRKFDDGFERGGRTVPLFSHANGSRMCGGKDTNKKG